jgi:hypothetical protein
MQRLAPNLHRWDRTVIFGIGRLRDDVGFVPRHDFTSMVESTYDWYRDEDTEADAKPDWSLEDEILSLVR